MQFFSFAPAHKYYFSLTEIKVNTFTKTMAVSSKLFIDDLEFALQKANNTKYDLTKSAENKAVNAALFNYMNSHLQIYIAGKIVPLSLVGFETENEVVWIYLESKINNKEFIDTKIVNSLLYDFSSEQTNMIQFKWNNKSQAEKLVYPNKELIINH
ncbi:MAG: hypothetical protein K9G64_08150 [Bacteroidia bacterium]|nr:hypothetical protein [Bacteroidia bacterium]